MQTSVDERHELSLRPAGNDTVYVDRSEREEIISIQFPVEVMYWNAVAAFAENGA